MIRGKMVRYTGALTLGLALTLMIVAGVGAQYFDAPGGGAPKLVFVLAPTPSASGWNNTDVAVMVECRRQSDDAVYGRFIVPATSGGTTLHSTEGIHTPTFVCKGTTADTGGQRIVRIDKTPPLISFTGNAEVYTVDETVAITCNASDAHSGIDTSTCANVNAPAYTFGAGDHQIEAEATDLAGNHSAASTNFSVFVTYDALCTITRRLVNHRESAAELCEKLGQAARTAARGRPGQAAERVIEYQRHVLQLIPGRVSADKAETLVNLASALY